ncbi:hypothetical protein SLS55_002243 [Diplodia seriata]|uniref:Branched-chain-amino-acid aminotransferase n=1 Tax=Diplodia seriata TaxID=420778 RepID=A0A0G2H3R7_9PEZI|nr:putative branched-chain-amino-acid aminotransferase [Diplodia seriata]OMP83427.1 Branched-chain-amino-acid aminotransferase, cytosolic [Diplodia seriata]
MSPSAVNPTTVSGLTEAGIEHHIVEHPPSSASNGPELAKLDASKLTTTFTTAPRPVPEPNSPEVMAQKVCTDHMVTVSWTADHGWHTPELKPYGPLSLMPTASCLHYATECFEGMKLYRGHDGALRLFRPDRNAARLLTSANRISLPPFEPAQLEALIAKLCAVDGPKWLPASRAGQFLYIRPTFIADDEALGVNVPKRALLYVIICNFPNLDKPTGSLDKPGLKLLASRDDMVRAWPGGFGYAKLGANYGPSLIAQGEARARGFDQILWLLGPDSLVTEAGASNFFVVWRAPESGKLQLVTAPLDDRIILDGVTRRSVLELARSRLVGGWAGAGDAEEETLEAVEIVERKFTMAEVVEAAAEGRLVEAFAAGTAFFIAPVGLIHFRGKDIEVPLAGGETGKYAHVIKTWLRNIMYGKENHEWARVVPDEGFQA